MIPILYDQNTDKEDFVFNGRGFIASCTSCEVTEIENGAYELAMTVPLGDRLTPYIIPGAFIKCLANTHDDPQLFEIKTVDRNNDTIEAKGQHIRYIAFNNVFDDTFAPVEAKTPAQWWDIAESYLVIGNLWDFTSDITTQKVVTAAKERPIRLGDFLAGKEGSLLDVFGGEYHFDNFDIEFLQRRGRDTGKCLRWGGQLSSVVMSSDSTTEYSHLLPYAYVKAQIYETNENAPSRPVYHDAIDLGNHSMRYQRALAYDFSDKMTDDTMFIYQGSGAPKNYEELATKLETLASNYVAKNITALTTVSVNIVVDVPEALEYLSDIMLTDTLLISFTPAGLTARTRVVKTTFDALEERYKKIELGTIRKNLSDLFSGKNIGGA